MFGGKFIGRLFGSEKALDTMVSGVAKGLDALVYTAEEKAGDAAKERSEARSMVVNWMAATSGQNIARRVLALVITSVWVLQYVATAGLSLAAVWAAEPARLQASADIIGGYANQMNGAMMLILAFYFAAPHMGSIVSAALNRFAAPKRNKV